MIYEKIDSMIATAIKDQAHAVNTLEVDSIKLTLEVYRAIKTELATMGYNATHIPTEAQEIAVLKGMIGKRRKAIDEYMKAGETQRAANEESEIDVISRFIPESAKGPSKKAVEAETKCVIKTFVELKSIEDPSWNGLLMPHMRHIIAKVKEKYPDAENGVIAAVVKSYK